jgi:DNA-binding transcriptional MerR regulator
MVQRNNGRNLRSGSLAKAAGVSPDTIRYYEKIGVLPKASRTDAGYRVYPQSAVERVLVVQGALGVGFSLAELAEVLKARDAGGTPCRRVYELAQEKLERIGADIEALKRTEKCLKQALSDWGNKMRQTGPGEKVMLLHSLVDIPTQRSNNLKRRSRT